MTFQLALWIELLAAGLGGLQGALFATTQRDRRIDVLGVLVIGIVVSLGGALLRDLLLNQPPVVIWVNVYLLVAAGAAGVGMLVHPIVARAGWAITVLDAVVMGLFGAIAATKALSLGVGSVGALVVGVVGAIGGGMLRDVILARPVSVLHVGTLYAVAAGSGVAVLLVLLRFGVPVPTAGLLSTALTAALRIAAVRFDWRFPAAGPQRPPTVTR
ncbi:trimeric intracellular cation channel family protein [Schumannella luteola]